MVVLAPGLRTELILVHVYFLISSVEAKPFFGPFGLSVDLPHVALIATRF